MNTFTSYDIFWSERIAVEFDWTKRQYTIGKLPDLDWKGGIYQIYGQHPVYGPDVLLYIGRTEDFGDRFAAHLKDNFNWCLNLSLSTGTVWKNFQGEERRLTCELEDLSRTEALLIFAHRPAFNTQGKNTSIPADPPIHIWNRDYRRQLMSEVSTRCYC
jgi:hypothetical protein